MKLKRFLFVSCILLLCYLPIMAANITGSYTPATADRDIWYLWSDLPSDIRAYYQNLNIGDKADHLYYHLGKLTIDIKPDGNPPIYYVVLSSPYSTQSVKSTVTWGGTQTSNVQLAIGIRKNHVVQTPINLNINSGGNTWGGWLVISGDKSNNEAITENTHLEVEFYLYTTYGMNFFAKDTPIYFQNIDLQMAQVSYSVDQNNTRRELILDNGTDEYDYWGGTKVPPDEETHRSDSENAQKQTLMLSVVENTELIDSGKPGVEQPVAKLEITTNNNMVPKKDYNLKIAMYDNDPIGTGHSLYYLHLDDDKSNHNAFLVTLDVAGQKTLNDPTQTITLSVPKGETIPIRKLVNASFVNTDNLNLPAGNYRDTVYVDIITGDS